MPLEPSSTLDSIVLIPALICARIATVAIVDGRLSGVRADAVYGAELSFRRDGLTSIPPSLTSAHSASWSSALALDFVGSLSRHMRTTHPDALALYMEEIPKDLVKTALNLSGRRALPIFLCANPDERVWHLPSLDGRHLRFATPNTARSALELALAVAMGSFATQGADLGLRILPGQPLHIESEARFDCAPCLPALPLSSIAKGHRGQSSHLWAPLCDQLACAIEAEQLSGATLLVHARARRSL